MADAAAASRRRMGRGCGWTLAIFFLLIGGCPLSFGIAALFGSSRAMSFDCTRATDACVFHDRIDRPIALSSIQSVAVTCGDVHIGTNADERECDLTATLMDGATQSLAESSGNDTSETEYRAAATQITAFLTSEAPTIHVAYTMREGPGSVFQNIMTGAFCLFFGVIGAYWLWKTRRPAA